MIPMTQYLRPNGERRAIEIQRPSEIEEEAHRLIAMGCHFDIEELTTLQISMTCENDYFDDPVLAHEICANGPEVPIAVDRLVASVANEILERQRNPSEQNAERSER